MNDRKKLPIMVIPHRVQPAPRREDAGPEPIAWPPKFNVAKELRARRGKTDGHWAHAAAHGVDGGAGAEAAAAEAALEKEDRVAAKHMRQAGVPERRRLVNRASAREFWRSRNYGPDHKKLRPEGSGLMSCKKPSHCAALEFGTNQRKTAHQVDEAAAYFWPRGYFSDGSRRGCEYCVETSRGGAAVVTWIFRGDAAAMTWIFRGDAAAATWIFCGDAAAATWIFRGDAAAATWIFRGGDAAATTWKFGRTGARGYSVETPYDVDIPWTRRGHDLDIPWRRFAATPRLRRGRTLLYDADVQKRPARAPGTLAASTARPAGASEERRGHVDAPSLA